MELKEFSLPDVEVLRMDVDVEFRLLAMDIVPDFS